MDVRKVLIVAAAALAAGGCAKSASAGGPSGSVHGTIVQSGGPRQAPPDAVAGTVVVSRDGDEVARQSVAAGQKFRFTLSAGTYTLSVAGVDGACADTDVTVTASVDSAVSLICQRK